jgi:hypothetical protein
MQSDVQKIADRYEHIVYWSDEDQCYIGQCPELLLGSNASDLKPILQARSKQVESLSDSAGRDRTARSFLAHQEFLFIWKWHDERLTTFEIVE